MDECIKVFKSLSDRTRLRILQLLLKAKRELCICEIMDSLRLPQYHISKHVKELKNAQLVTEQRRGKFVFYSLSPANNQFHEFAVETVNKMPDRYFKTDNKKLKKRLSLRKRGTCVVGTVKTLCGC